MKFLRILAFLFLLSFGSTIFFIRILGSEGSRLPMEIRVQSGMSVPEVAATLKEHGIITSALAFRFYLQMKGLDTGIRTGRFSIPEDASFSDIAKILASAEGRETAITIPEGYTVAQIDELLVEKGFIQPGELIGCAASCVFASFEFISDREGIAGSNEERSRRLEGYLFPDTYFVNPDEFVAKFFLERMLGTFRTRIIDGLKDDFAESKRPLEDIIVMASLIERETATDPERPVVSGILWKRFDANLGLAVDATVRYILKKDTEPLTKTDLETDSPYNTRKYVGLPPGAIANPGLESIRAALHPEDSPYWYYLHGKDGMIRYAETNDEHNLNKAKYL